MAATADVAVKFMASAEAREKALKLFTNVARVAHSVSGDAQHVALAKSLSDGRSLLRLVQHGNQLTAIRDIVARGNLGCQQHLTIVRNVFELGFLCLNNAALFSKWGLMRIDVRRANYRGTLCLLGVYTVACIVDVLKMIALDAKNLKDGADDYVRQWRRLLLDLARHLCDALASLSQSQLLTGATCSDRTVALLGGASGLAACYINWKSARESLEKKQKA
uniref:Glycosomal membrane protein n=1 Tax=Neobodo designis TaxID=312471 RepID=A0A7S1LYE2_NEODS